MRKWIPFVIEQISELDQRLAKLADSYDLAQVLIDRYSEASGIYHEKSRFKLLAGFGAIETVTCALAELEYGISSTDWYLGFFSYQLKSQLFKLKDCHKESSVSFPDLLFFRPRFLIRSDGHETSVGYDDQFDNESDAMSFIEKIKLISLSETFKREKDIKVTYTVSEQDYKKTVESIQQHILRGDIYEMNYCIEFTAHRVNNPPHTLFAGLMDVSPMPFSAFLKVGNLYVICASPERYIKKEGNKVLSMPMKGTMARKANSNITESEKNLLLESEKEQAENIMITDLVRNDLSRVAKPGSVKVDELCGVYPFPNVMQMVSTVSCELKDNIGWAEPVRCSFPMGSMTGAPKQRALELIDTFEKGSRGLYSGAIGYVTPDRDYDFNVVIRSLFLDKELEKASFWVGSAITFNANATDEYNECLLKAGALMKILNQPPNE